VVTIEVPPVTKCMAGGEKKSVKKDDYRGNALRGEERRKGS
jgi:hypothetical protein